ncbi:hypothetical protein SEEH0134_17229 [Salmonella enterica subsp. enterica serovar Heidelberg str. N20134]|nr:hypothetical protein SEEH5757_24222 [Salmonella enterica subsp. enterica serovar Heidelberg str. N15757]EYI43249.1 hypothetical protein SEEH9341_19411 [Salmonella enterica subsp. enterica serovar Heidelberg str. N29341]EYI62118.1 hypothetical protein SEEH0134_17229 [Salmonella enterica subsp. enterica serovar Heidelberg str. N20134]EYI96741.1 hypothetical protein SEEH8453_08186 [Salmonella enterica subsp. enterica serovar Heidelberg str. N18453]KJU20254.1 hypothetical protein SEEH0486_04069 
MVASNKFERWSGLSPLARGTLDVDEELLNRCRFIPAGAGNTNGHSKSNGSGTVYPRWRGEHTKRI